MSLTALDASALAKDDPRHWAILFTRARKRKGWTYVRLGCEAGITRRAAIRACVHGDSKADTILKLVHALDITILLPQPPRVLTAREAQYGR